MFNGSIVALVTPMRQNGEIDFSALEKLVAMHLHAKTNALAILGTTGEAPTIKSDERKAIIQRVVAQVDKKIPVIVGTGTNSTQSTCELTEQAMALGADGALVVTPYYNKPTQSGLFAHYQAVSKVGCPILLYNVPGRTGVDLSAETVTVLAELKSIVGVKDASDDLDRVGRWRTDIEKPFSILTGNDGTAYDFLKRGGDGVISVTANVAPALMYELCYAASKAQWDKAQQVDAKMRAIHEALFLESNPIPVKWALQTMGLIDSGIRLPLTPLNEKYYDAVRSGLKQAGV